MSKKILAIIGLRSGSKGLKNKNIKKLNGKPLFTYIFDIAKKSRYINRIRWTCIDIGLCFKFCCYTSIGNDSLLS